MCGITGAVPGISPDLLRKMTSRLAHRGPDGEGYVCAPDFSFGHRRLAVIDLHTGQQPISTPDGRFTIIFNGEIYNFRELRAGLLAAGVQLATHSDTEVLLHTFARAGIRAIERLRGMFAFAIWDAAENALWLVRDRLGVKPLYYTRAGRHLLFASEIKALLAHPQVERDLNPQAVDDFLAYLYIAAPQTIFRNIFELPPAHWLRWHRGQVQVERYWDAIPQPAATPRNERVGIEETRATFTEAVHLRMVSDVPVGAFLSGGLDSSSIVAAMSQAADAPVRTFSLGFGSGAERYSELPFARFVADRYRTHHHEIEITPRSADLLPALVRHFDEPFGNPTALLLYQLSQKARAQVTVALAGDGGDEVFLGYPRHLGAVLQARMQSMPRALRAVLAGGSRLLREDSSGAHGWRRVREFLASATAPWQQAYIQWVTYFSPAMRDALYTPEFRAALNGYRAESFIEKWFARARHADPAAQVSYVDLHTFLPHNLLEYGDRMSMAHGLEIRLPFTDHKLVELAMRTPSRWKLKGRSSKHILREAMRPSLPREVLERRKLGLNPPLGIWLKGELAPWMDAALDSRAVAATGWFRTDAVAELRRDFHEGRRDYSLHLWALLVLDEWRRQMLEPSTAQAHSADFLGATA